MTDQSITVAVGSPNDLQSNIWRLWVQGDDVYFGSKMTLPHLKVSLHKSGNWHVAWSRSPTKNKLKDRAVFQWKRTPEFKRGLVSAIVVFIYPFPTKKPFKNKRIEDTDIIWLPVPMFGKMIALGVLIATPEADLDAGRFLGNRIIGKLKKKNGESVLLVSEEILPIQSRIDVMTKLKAETKITVRNFDRAEFFDNTRLLFFLPPSTPKETPSIFDVTLDWDNIFPEKRD